MIDAALASALAAAEDLELVTTGRHTGTAHTVRVWFAVDDDALWLRGDADADWVRNLDRDARCRIRAGAVERAARREAVADRDAALRRAVDLWRAKYGAEWVSDWYVERGRVAVRIVPE